MRNVLSLNYLVHTSQVIAFLPICLRGEKGRNPKRSTWVMIEDGDDDDDDEVCWIYPPPRMPVANEGLGWDSRIPDPKNVTIPVLTGILGWGGRSPNSSILGGSNFIHMY